MARTVARLPAGSRITDHISLGIIAKTFPLRQVHSVLIATGTASVRERNLPSHVMVYYVIAMALYMHSHDRLRADIGGRTRPVLDDELLPSRSDNH